MIYNGVNIIFYYLPFGQGMVINSKLCLVKFVKDKSKKYIHLDSTCDVIQHELQHCKDIALKGWLNFMGTTLWHYIWNKHDKSGWEGNANEAEKEDNYLLRFELMKYCTNNNLLWY